MLTSVPVCLALLSASPVLEPAAAEPAVPAAVAPAPPAVGPTQRVDVEPSAYRVHPALVMAAGAGSALAVVVTSATLGAAGLVGLVVAGWMGRLPVAAPGNPPRGVLAAGGVAGVVALLGVAVMGTLHGVTLVNAAMTGVLAGRGLEKLRRAFRGAVVVDVRAGEGPCGECPALPRSPCARGDVQTASR